MKKSTIASLGTFVLVLVLGAAYISLGVLNYRPWVGNKNVTMNLDNTSQLLPGSGVLLRGVRIGQVDTIGRENGRVVARLRYDQQYNIPQSSEIRIEQLSAVGEPYIDFRPNSLDGPYFSADQTIDTAAVKQPMALPDVFELISGLTSSLDSTELGGITETLVEATSGTEAALPNLEQAGDMLAETIMTQMPNIRRMLENTQNYQSDMAWLPEAITDLGASNRVFIEKDIEVIEALTVLVDEAGTPAQLTETVNPFLFQIAPDTSRLLSNLGPITEPLAPIVAALTDVLPQIDIAALLTRALNTVGTDGAANLTVVIPPER